GARHRVGARRRRRRSRRESVAVQHSRCRCVANLECHPQPMDIDQAMRTRRTHKVFGPEPVDRKTLDELFELARWAPNHHGTNPWRFRVLGPGALTRLKQAAGREQETKLSRAPTL